ncbi:MAG: tRNA (adenosine(37)-N6)-dimethylallyltransferase MiaA [bacterium]|nr:tRNA (adenosine(37)-N6)-dimethylallyltransferase MiaA [bacterium]
MQHRLIVIIGPTASGKTALAIRLAKKFNGEIISADSRQVYTGLDIGTGKAPRDKSKVKNQNETYISDGIAHHLIDVSSPKRQFTVVQYQRLAQKAVSDILRKNKVPIVCGGTGQYIDALVYGLAFPKVKPNRKLREKLERKPIKELFYMLKKLDPRRSKTIDPHNSRRLIRALEIVLTTKRPVPTLAKKEPRYEALWLGLNPVKKILHHNIHKRLLARMKQGMVSEVKKLKKQGVSSRRLESLGLEYRYINRRLEGHLKKQQMIGQLEREIRNYAKRQMTWFGRNRDIHWISVAKEAWHLVKRFLNRKKT